MHMAARSMEAGTCSYLRNGGRPKCSPSPGAPRIVGIIPAIFPPSRTGRGAGNDRERLNLFGVKGELRGGLFATQHRTAVLPRGRARNNVGTPPRTAWNHHPPPHRLLRCLLFSTQGTRWRTASNWPISLWVPCVASCSMWTRSTSSIATIAGETPQPVWRSMFGAEYVPTLSTVRVGSVALTTPPKPSLPLGRRTPTPATQPLHAQARHEPISVRVRPPGRLALADRARRSGDSNVPLSVSRPRPLRRGERG